jgi:hypothetical protein
VSKRVPRWLSAIVWAVAAAAYIGFSFTFFTHRPDRRIGGLCLAVFATIILVTQGRQFFARARRGAADEQQSREDPGLKP